jgi:phospholipid/cholesterol/gamma-HCH transport system substrate-binding protein
MSPSTAIGAQVRRVAALAALAIALITVIVLAAGSRDTYRLQAVFDDVRGLIVGGKVTAGSQTVGSVTEIGFDTNGDPVVTMEIDGDFRVHRGAFADLRVGSNVGVVNRTVDLTEGDPTAPELDDGATLGPSSTDQPVDLDLAVSTLDPRTRENVALTIAGIERAIRDRGADFDRTLRHSAIALNESADLLAQVNADGEALRAILADGGRVVGALAEDPAALAGAAERTAALLETTGSRQLALQRSIELLGPSLAAGRDTVERVGAAIPSLRALAAGARPLIDELGPTVRLLPPAVSAARPFLRQSRLLVEEAPAALRAQRPFLRAAGPVIAKLGPTVELLNPLLDQIRVFTPETIGFFQNFADLLSNYDVNGHVVRNTFLPIQTGPRPSALAAGEIGPNDSGPGLLAQPFRRSPGVLEGEPWENFEDSFIGSGP